MLLVGLEQHLFKKLESSAFVVNHTQGGALLEFQIYKLVICLLRYVCLTKAAYVFVVFVIQTLDRHFHRNDGELLQCLLQGVIPALVASELGKRYGKYYFILRINLLFAEFLDEVLVRKDGQLVLCPALIEDDFTDGGLHLADNGHHCKNLRGVIVVSHHGGKYGLVQPSLLVNRSNVLWYVLQYLLRFRLVFLFHVVFLICCKCVVYVSHKQAHYISLYIYPYLCNKSGTFFVIDSFGYP